MTNKPHIRLLKVVGVVLIIGTVVMLCLGNRLNSDQLLGCLTAGALMFLLSLVFFIFGGLPFRALGGSDRVMKWAFIFACVSFVYSIFQIPVWSWMTHQFPPGTMTGVQAGWATAGVVVSLFGPAAPLIVKFGRFIRAQNNEQKEALRRKKSERNDQVQ